jgi:hypothetical protein
MARAAFFFLVAFLVYTIGGAGPAALAHNAGHEWALVAWAVPVIAVGLATLIGALVAMWQDFV